MLSSRNISILDNDTWEVGDATKLNGIWDDLVGCAWSRFLIWRPFFYLLFEMAPNLIVGFLILYDFRPCSTISITVSIFIK
jgi:hypothetical protein